MKIDLRKLSGKEALKLLKVFLEYNTKTGDFIWKKRGGGVKNGDIAGCLHCKGYVHIVIYGKQYKAHRLAWLYMTGEWPKHEIDHKNHIKNDNRFENLRDTRENSKNRTENSNSSSGHIGVYECSPEGK